MGVYSEYLDRNLSFQDIVAERKKQLQRISTLRGGRDLLVYAADLNKGAIGAPISIDYSDILPIHDQLANLNGKEVDVILETPGGDGAIAEDIVRLLRGKYAHVAFIIPGFAKSAGTIIAMSGDELLMGQTSALGPIDAQLTWQGKVFSAEALLEGMEKIKQEVLTTGTLNRAYIPMLQNISPGELQSAQNALDFARVLVTDWLAKFKFKDWQTHSSTGQPVTDSERRARAEEIADELRSHKKWLTHSRSIKLDDLRAMRLVITDYAATPDLSDAIMRYYTLLQMSFATNIYKVIETAHSQIYRFIPQPAQVAPAAAGKPQAALIEVLCSQCGERHQVQANLGVAQPLQPGNIPFPGNNRLKCPKCAAETDLSDARRQIEAQAKQKVVA
jgi:ClpP class serine protease